ncbi:MAG: PAS domain S-box protein, partial [Candidatus Paceibacterota bacterium]
RGYKSVISLPLSDSSQTFGGFTIFSENINAFSGDEVKILEELANDLAFGITSLRINVQSKLLEEELLKASTDRYKALFVSSRDAVMTLEAPSWNFTSGNPTAIKMFGAKNEGDFLYHEPWSLSPKLQPDGQNSMEKAKEMIEKAMKEGSNFFEWTHKRINGEEFPAEVLLSKVEQDGKTFLHALVRDISERKKLDAKLKEYAEERFKAIFDNTNDGIILADLETKKFILSNTAFCQMLGYSADEILKLSVLDIHPQEDLPNVLEQFEKQAKKELKVARDLRVKRKDGTVFYCDINSSPITMNGKKYLIGIFRDTTERRRSEEALRTSEEQFRNIFENGQYGIVLTGSDSRFFKVNPAFCKMLGFTEAELLTKKFSDITHPDNVKADMESVPKMISGEMSNYQTEKRYIKKNGQEIWVNLIISAVRNLDGSFGYFLGMVEDISERKKLDEAKSGFLAITSHQLRTPLTATKWVLEVMMDDKDLTENQKEKINDLTSSNNRLIGLVERLLNVTRIESGKMVVKKELTNLKKLIVDLVSDVEELSQEKKKNIKIVAPENLKDIYLDPVLIREALENLLVNAIDYSEEGSNEISVTVKDRIGDCVVSVHSFGFIEESLATKINKFDKFVRGSDASNKKPSGSGLGLFITKKVIEANGGAFWFESDAKHGTTFHFSVVKDNLI